MRLERCATSETTSRLHQTVTTSPCRTHQIRRVIPAKAGIHNACLPRARLRGNDLSAVSRRATHRAHRDATPFAPRNAQRRPRLTPHANRDLLRALPSKRMALTPTQIGNVLGRHLKTGKCDAVWEASENTRIWSSPSGYTPTQNWIYSACGVYRALEGKRISVSRILAVVLLFFITACAATRFSGISQASPKLRDDTIATLQPFFLAKSGCSKISQVQADIPSLPPFMKSTNVRVLPDKPLSERWTVFGCGTNAAFDVEFTPDGEGGAFIGVQWVPSAP